MTPVTDPQLIAQLDAPAAAPAPVTDPAVLAQLGGNAPPLKIGAAGFNDAMTQVARETPWLVRNYASAGMNSLGNIINGVKQFFGNGDDQSIQAGRIMNKEAPIGSLAGNAALLAATGFIPGANTTAGAGIVGTVQGLLQPTQGNESRGLNALEGGALGSGGQLIGGKVASLIANRAAAATAEGAAQASRNAPRDATLAAGQSAGYVVPPSTVNPSSWIAQRLESLGGKAATGQEASLRNQDVTNALVRKSLGLADDAPITQDALNAIRSQQGQAYEAIKALPSKFKSDAQYQHDIATLGNDFSSAAAEFPEVASNSGIQALQSGLAKDEISPTAAIEMIKKLRSDATGNFKALGDPAKTALAGAQKDAATALENLVERNLLAHDTANFALNKSGANLPTDHLGLIDNFRNARQMIAKTYDVEKALNTSTGQVDARTLAGLMNKGSPLTGDLATAARFADAFPQFTREASRVPTPGVSALEPMAALALGLGGHMAAGPAGIAAAALPYVRPAARSTLLSDAAQRVLAQPSYGPGATTALAAKVATPNITSLIAKAAARQLSIPAPAQ